MGKGFGCGVVVGAILMFFALMVIGVCKGA